MRNQNKNFLMNNQRTLFKKFFNGNKKDNSHTQINQSGGFNPPKFQFNKKKLGLGLINNGDSEDKKMFKELESVEIESEVITNDHIEYNEYTEDDASIAHTGAVSVTDTIADSDSVMTSVMNTATWNTLKTMNTMKTMNSDINRISTTSYDDNKICDYDQHKISMNNNNVSTLYSNTLEKNKQRYNLSNQLESFSIQLEVFQKEIEEKRSRMDLLLLSFEEKLGKYLGILIFFKIFL